MRFVALFALIALVEMATFFWVGSKIGFGWALGIAVTTAVIGSILVRRAGLSVMSRFRQKTGQGQIPVESSATALRSSWQEHSSSRQASSQTPWDSYC